jgi:hypothetical protein
VQRHPRDRSLDAVTIQRVEGGFPHSEILGSKLVRSSPRLIAAYHVLHRLSAPRHPPDALTTLDYSHDQCPLGYDRTKISRKTCLSDCSKRHVFACQAYPAHTAAGRGWFAGLGCLLAEYAASLRFQTSALTRTAGNTNSFDIRIIRRSGGACRDRTDDLKLAKLPLSQLS